MRAATLGPRRGRYESSAAVAVLMLTRGWELSALSANSSALAPMQRSVARAPARMREGFIENSF
jgi:hypothetical protein